MTAQSKAILLFPPNWTACVYGPHLAMPLLAGVGGAVGWDVTVQDLSEEFYRLFGAMPRREDIVRSSEKAEFECLDELYFAWEDSLRAYAEAGSDGASFGLLSGYSFSDLRDQSLTEVLESVRRGTVYSSFIANSVMPRLLGAEPNLIGVTIASQEQLIPAVELLQVIRVALPGAFLILGGNIVTRLRDTPAFDVLSSLADQTVVFQGDRAFRQTLDVIGRGGVEGARRELPRVAGDEEIHHLEWPTPHFGGIDFESIVGVPVLPYVSTRGCYWGKCPFCAIPAGWSKSGFGGMAPAEHTANQLISMVEATGIPRIKFVDEAFPPKKVRPLAALLRAHERMIEWEAYARLDLPWQDANLLGEAYAGGLRKLYFGLEQAPTASRSVFGKNDRADPIEILKICKETGIQVHLFCMVGHPRTTRDDALATVEFLLQHQNLINAADMVSFRLDRGTIVPGVKPILPRKSDWLMSNDFEPTEPGVLDTNEISALENECQEIIWENCPRLLHPLYRLVGNWQTAKPTQEASSLHPRPCLSNT